MKIAFYSGENGQEHVSKIIEILKGHVPAHQYNDDADIDEPDLWHCATPHTSVSFVPHIPRSVVALSDIRFLTDPQIFSLSDRIFKHPLYRYHCRHAARLIAQDMLAKQRVVDALGVDGSKVEVCPISPLIDSLSGEHTPTQDEMLSVRDKLQLKDTYILIEGEMDTMHDHGVIFRSIFAQAIPLNIIVHGRRTTHSDVLLKMVRDVGAADRVQFIYEASDADMCSIYKMALMMIYMPTFESSVLPIVEALYQYTPMILSDTPLNRETAGDAAVYVAPHNQDSLAAAIKMMVYDESFRGQLSAQCWAEAKRYSKESVAKQLAAIYESV